MPGAVVQVALFSENGLRWQAANKAIMVTGQGVQQGFRWMAQVALFSENSSR